MNWFGMIKILLGLSTVACVLEFALGGFSDSRSLTNLYLCQLCFVFAVSYATTVSKLGWTHIFSLLQFTTLVFMISTPLLSPLADGDTIRIAYSPIREVFDERIVQRVLVIFGAYVATGFLVYFCGRPVAPQKYVLNAGTRRMYFVIGKTSLILMLPFALYYAMFLISIGRANLYSAGTGALGMPLYIRVANMVYTVGYFLIVASKPSFKEYSIYTLLYFISLIPTLLSGERGEVLLVIVFYVWYISNVYKKRIKWFVIAILGIAGVVISYVISLTRQELGVEAEGLFKIILTFFSESSTTFKLTAFYVENKDSIPHNLPFFLDQPFYGLTSTILGLPSAGQSLEMVEVRSSLAHNLVYYLNPGYYLNGNSMGTAWVAECYEFGIIGVILGATVLSLFVRFFETRIVGSRYFSILTYMFFGLIIMSPRSSLFPSLYTVLKWFIVTLVLCVTYRFMHYKSKVYSRMRTLNNTP